jgi:hypothetical protein
VFVDPLIGEAGGGDEDLDDLVAVEGGVGVAGAYGDPGIVGGVLVGEDANGAIWEADDGVFGDVFDVFAVAGIASWIGWWLVWHGVSFGGGGEKKGISPSPCPLPGGRGWEGRLALAVLPLRRSLGRLGTGEGAGLQQLTEPETGAGPGPDWLADPGRGAPLLDFRLGRAGQRLVAGRPIGRGKGSEGDRGTRGQREGREGSTSGLGVEMRLGSVATGGSCCCCAGCG